MSVVGIQNALPGTVVSGTSSIRAVRPVLSAGLLAETPESGGDVDTTETDGSFGPLLAGFVSAPVAEPVVPDALDANFTSGDSENLTADNKPSQRDSLTGVPGSASAKVNQSFDDRDHVSVSDSAANTAASVTGLKSTGADTTGQIIGRAATAPPTDVTVAQTAIAAANTAPPQAEKKSTAPGTIPAAVANPAASEMTPPVVRQVNEASPAVSDESLSSVTVETPAAELEIASTDSNSAVESAESHAIPGPATGVKRPVDLGTETRDAATAADTSAGLEATSATPSTQSVVAAATANTSSAATKPTTAPQTIAEQVSHEALRHAEVVEREGQKTFTMRLDPPELGELVVRMKRTAAGVSMHVSAAESATLSLVRASINDLSSNLSRPESVFQELSIDVTTGEGFSKGSSRDAPQGPLFRRPRDVESTESPSQSTTDETASRQVSFVA